MSWAQALALAVLQGASELFPVSSLGHIVLVPALVHWRIDRAAPTFLAFVVALHLGTAVALVVYYRSEWAGLVRAVLASIVRGRLSDDPLERVGWLVVVGTIPVGILGVFLEKPVRELFGSTALVAGFLVLNGLGMFAGEALKQRARRGTGGTRSLPALGFGRAVGVGFAQALALLPGISRSGAAIAAGLLCDLPHEDAARYAFLLATPVIGAASLLELPKLFAPAAHGVLAQAAVGGVVAGLAAYASVAFLVRYFRSNDLRPFGWYCVALGALCLVLVRLGAIA
ncbi:MAG: undecaprenyl-diphosphate phosphatase [Vulcanimicrobiaceae bacterium]